MKRITLIKLHLYFSGVSIVLLTLYASTGALYLLGFKGAEQSSLVKVVEAEVSSKEELEESFVSLLKEEVPNYKYEYIKGSDTSLISRPANRLYYSVKYLESESKIELHKREPNLHKALMELHKGHGARMSKNLLAFMGLLYVFTLLSGLYLGLTVKAYRKTTLVTLGSGFLIFLIAFMM